MTPQERDFLVRFAFDNMVDGFRDETLIVWQAYDTIEHCEVWIIGRKIKEGTVLPLAKLLPDSQGAVKRYAPKKGQSQDYDYSQIEKPLIIRP